MTEGAEFSQKNSASLHDFLTPTIFYLEKTKNAHWNDHKVFARISYGCGAFRLRPDSATPTTGDS